MKGEIEMLANYDKYFTENDSTVDVIAQKIAKAGNRSERRKIVKALNKTNKIAKYANEQVRKDAKQELERRSNDSFGYILSMAAIVLHDVYKWDDDAIGDFVTEISKRLDSEWSDGKTVDDVAKELFEKTGIELVVK